MTILPHLLILTTLKSQVNLDSSFFKEREIAHIKIDENNMLRFSEYLNKKDLIPLHYTYNDCSYNHILNNILRDKKTLRQKKRNALGWGGCALLLGMWGSLYHREIGVFQSDDGIAFAFLSGLSATILLF